MEEEDHILCGLLFTYICTLYKRLNNRSLESPRQVKLVEPKRARIGNKSRKRPGYFEVVFRRMKAKDDEDFFMKTRMTASLFESLASLVQRELCRVLLPQKISTEERLAITLLYLAKGVSIRYIVQIYKLSSLELARDIILKTCEVLWNVLQPIYVVEPSESEYKSIAKNFYAKWDAPNCVGAISIKQIMLENSAQKAESHYQKLVLMATCDHCYVFTSVSLGNKNEFRSTSFGEALMDNVLSLPEIEVLAGDNLRVPYYFAGNSALPLRNNLMRPYPGLAQNSTRQIFNYRLSRAHQVIENAFGILTARWQIFQKPINATEEDGEKIVLAAIALHNFIMSSDKRLVYCPENYADWEDEHHIIKAGNWRADAKSVGSALLYSQCCIGNASKSAFKRRDDLAKYFENEGKVEFQDEAVSRFAGRSIRSDPVLLRQNR